MNSVLAALSKFHADALLAGIIWAGLWGNCVVAFIRDWPRRDAAFSRAAI